MTAKETLLMEGVKDPNFGMLTGTMPVILSAMESYAKQECIAFIKYLSEQAYDFSADVPIDDDEEAEDFYIEYLKTKTEKK